MVPLAKLFEFSLKTREKKPAIAVPVAITNAMFLIRVRIWMSLVEVNL